MNAALNAARRNGCFPPARRSRGGFRCVGPEWCAVMMLLAFVVAPRSLGAEPASHRPPNFVIVLADDLGYGDLRCFGNRSVFSPNLDRFAAEGMKLTNCYAAAANCSPSRTGLMTGRTPYRVGIHNWIPMMSPMHVRRSEITIATLLRKSGYTTCHVGKWHLNGHFNLPDQPQPSDHGFDYWFSTQNNALPCHRDPDNFVRNGRPAGRLHGYSAQLVVDEAKKWLLTIRDKTKPFFLFVCFHEPHEPIATAPRFSALYPDDGPRSPFDPSTSTYAAHHGNITQMDHAFGRLMKTLDDAHLTQSTLVLFTSDNGPAITAWHPHGSAGPLRDKKGSMYEGGIRVPGMIRWPGHTNAGQVCTEPVSGVDLLPTLCDIAGIHPPTDRVLDGASFLPIFAGQPIERQKPLYWQFNVARSEPKVAIRWGDWKLLATLTGPPIKPYGDIRAADQQQIKTAQLNTFELYNLEQDVGESRELSQVAAGQLEKMKPRMATMYEEVRRESPVWPAWTFPGIEGKRIRALREALKNAPPAKNGQ